MTADSAAPATRAPATSGGMVSVLELVLVAGMSVFLLGVIITLFAIASRTYANTVSHSDVRREVHATLDGVVSELRNARGVARCLDTYESGSSASNSSECRKVDESAWAINEVASDGLRFCFFTYELADDASTVGDVRVLRAPGRLCVQATDTDATDPDGSYRLELQRWASRSDDYFELADDGDDDSWLAYAVDEFASETPPYELVGYVAKRVERAGSLEPVAPFRFRDDAGTELDPADLTDASALTRIRTVEIDLTLPYDHRVGHAVTKPKYFTYQASVALRGAVYEGEQTWRPVG